MYIRVHNQTAKKSLFYQLFKIAKENNYNNIFLQAVAHGPFDVTSKYKKIGFLSSMVLYGDLEIVKQNNDLFNEVKVKDIFNHPTLSLHYTISSFLWKVKYVFLLKIFRNLIVFLQRLK